MQKTYTLDRDRLYSEVWAEPMSQVSKRYEISDVALAKICRKLAVPTPERGYWALIAHGQKPRTTTLPKRMPNKPQTVDVHPTLPNQPAVPENAESIEQIPVADVLVKPHRLTVALQRSLLKQSPDSYGRVSSRREDIDVSVAPTSVPRILRIVDAFVKAADERGFSFILRDPDRDKGLSLVIGRQFLEFGFLESSRRAPLSIAATRDRLSTVYSPITHTPTGALSFKLQEFLGERYKPVWADRAKEPLELQLGLIMKALVQAAQESKKRSEERAREAEIARVRQEEWRKAEIQQKKFSEDVADWASTETAKLFVAHCERQLEDSPSTDGEYAERWLRWAKEQSTRLDPFGKGTDAFLNHYLDFGWGSTNRKR